MYPVGFALMMIYSVKFRERYRVNKKTAVALTLITYVFGVAGAFAMGRINFAVTERVIGKGEGGVAIFGAVVFCPLLLLLAFLVQNLITKRKNDFRRQMDLLTPGIFMILTCAKFGCSLEGCCLGVAWEHGVFNPRVGMKVFPVQIFEVVSMISVLLLARLIERSKRFVPGMKYPVTAVLYCAVRFGWEFLRYYPDEGLRHLALGMSLWQLFCIAVGAVSLAVIFYLAKSKRIRLREAEIADNKKKTKKIKNKRKVKRT